MLLEMATELAMLHLGGSKYRGRQLQWEEAPTPEQPVDRKEKGSEEEEETDGAGTNLGNTYPRGMTVKNEPEVTGNQTHHTMAFLMKTIREVCVCAL